MIYPPLDHFTWLLAALLIGACVGSFLNVVIYRLPLGLSVNHPRRSFCPSCNKPISAFNNIPLVSWLRLRGRCAGCDSRIPFRYFAVELLTCVLFAAAWAVVVNWAGSDIPTIAHLTIIPVWLMIAVFIAIAFIDAEHMIVPLELTVLGTVSGVLASFLLPRLPDLAGLSAGEFAGKWDGLIQSSLGWAVGFFGLWAIVLGGKMVFGKFKLEPSEPEPFRLEEPLSEDEELIFEFGSERIPWSEMFFRRSDRLLVEAQNIVADGENYGSGTLTIAETWIELPAGKKIPIEQLKTLEGMATQAVVPREAMGMGDAHIMGMVGAFFGAFGVLFTLFAASIIAIVTAMMSRIGFGVRLPFGPFLVLGAAVWFFGGYHLAQWYLGLLR